MVNLDLSFWSEKKVLITGHTGFKGSWLTIWLKNLNAKVYGYSLEEKEELNLFNSFPKTFVSENINHYVGDIRDKFYLDKVINEIKPDIVFHLAAQALVKRGYKEPLLTWETNVIGSLNLLSSIKEINVQAIISNWFLIASGLSIPIESNLPVLNEAIFSNLVSNTIFVISKFILS